MGKDSFFLKPAFDSDCRNGDEIKRDGLRRQFDRLAALFAVTWALLAMAITAVPVHCFAVEIVDRVVAIVNNDVVSLYELNQSVRPFIEQIQSSQYPEDVERQLKFEVRQRVLQQLIDQKLADQELARLQITVSENEVDLAIERMKEANFLTDETLRAGLQRQGLTYEEYREQIKKQLLRAKLVNREIRSKIVITEEDIKDYYSSHAASYAGEKKYLLKNIYTRLPSVATEQDKQIAAGIMETIHQELENGKPFDTIAEEYAGVTATIETGNLGYFKLDDLSGQLQGLLASMQAGTFTPVLEADFGYQIVYVESIEEVGGKTLEEAAPEIRKKLYDEVVDQKYESWLQVLRDRSHIKIIN
jgi:peptidyl-prolyl cis-trans isomerase SurA